MPITVVPNENGSMLLYGTFKDSGVPATESEAAIPPALVTPKTAKWSLYDGQGDTVNANKDVVLLNYTTHWRLLLKGSDLEVPIHNNIKREFVMSITYDSDIGDDIPENESAEFAIKNITGIPPVATEE
jgi:hypothetical protein